MYTDFYKLLCHRGANKQDYSYQASLTGMYYADFYTNSLFTGRN